MTEYKQYELYQSLLAHLRGLNRAVLAFSGGVDSTFLLKACQEALGDGIKAVTVCSPYIPRWEIAEATALARELGVAHELIEAPVIPEIRHNPPDRCYLCKRAVFARIREVADRDGCPWVLDGTNFDDTGDYRPGLKALRELNIHSPLLECRLTKQDIRSLSRQLGLNTWDKPAYACLLTRIPYGSELREEDFVRIEQAEVSLMKRGFRAVRVRCHGNLARIEVPKTERDRLFDTALLDAISAELKAIGFQYVTLDLEGYRTGSLNETLARTE